MEGFFNCHFYIHQSELYEEDDFKKYLGCLQRISYHYPLTLDAVLLSGHVGIMLALSVRGPWFDTRCHQPKYFFLIIATRKNKIRIHKNLMQMNTGIKNGETRFDFLLILATSINKKPSNFD